MKLARKALTALLALALLAGCSTTPKTPAAPENPTGGEGEPVQGGTYITRQLDPSFNPTPATTWRPIRRATFQPSGHTRLHGNHSGWRKAGVQRKTADADPIA